MTEPKLVLCDFPAFTRLDHWESFSPFVLQVVRALKLAKLPFEHRRVDMMKLKQLNPKGQLPVLIIGDEKVADSTVIMHRIEAMRPGSLSAGLDARGLAEAWLWEEFAETSLYPLVLTTRWEDDRGWPVPREAFFGKMPALLRAVVPDIVRRGTRKRLAASDFTRGGLDACYARMRGVLDSLDTRAPATGFWLGERASVADVGLFAQLHSLRMPHTAFQADEVAKRERLSRYLDRVDQATFGEA